MSVDLILPGSHRRPTRQGSAIKDLVILFSGGPSGSGRRLQPGEDSTSRLVRKLEKIADAPRPFEVRAYEGGLNLPTGEISQYLRRNFHPDMKIILYGLSMGGHNAIRFAWQISQSLTYYEFETGQFYAFHPGKSDHSTIGLTRIDLMVTVDAAIGPGSGSMHRHIPPAVRRNVNFFQIYPADTYARGGPHIKTSEATEIENIPWSHRYSANPDKAHYDIAEDAMPEAFRRIHEELKR
jgi:pimeloyl-ACP methyl ester carboxylesterase